MYIRGDNGKTKDLGIKNKLHLLRWIWQNRKQNETDIFLLIINKIYRYSQKKNHVSAKKLKGWQVERLTFWKLETKRDWFFFFIWKWWAEKKSEYRNQREKDFYFLNGRLASHATFLVWWMNNQRTPKRKKKKSQDIQTKTWPQRKEII